MDNCGSGGRRTRRGLMSQMEEGAAPDVVGACLVSAETTPMGSWGIPSTVGGRGAVERAGLEDQRGEFIQVGAASVA